MQMKFLDESYIKGLLSKALTVSGSKRKRILDKAENMEGLSPSEAAALLVMESAEDWERVFAIAGAIKDHIYGDRVVMFAPLYISDYCVNDCAYCGFSSSMAKGNNRKLTQAEIKREVELLSAMGHKRLALEAGEDPENCPLSYVLESIQTIYGTKMLNGEIRRVNVNIAALDVEGCRQLKAAGIGTYILFQETYHRPTYETVHRAGPKKDFIYHAEALDRAMEAGLDDVGGGVLFGLYDPRYEVLGMILHNAHLENRFGVGFHTLSAPRIRDRGNVKSTWPYAVEDEMFRRMVAIMRLAVPFTGIIISTREGPAMRRKLIKAGVSQISGGSAVSVGGYDKKSKKTQNQFTLSDERSASDIILWLIEEGLIPSFCTACYRRSRTGDRFMAMAKGGDIKHICQPNALLTLAEYALDYGTDLLKEKAFALIDQKADALTREKIQRIIAGERDLHI